MDVLAAWSQISGATAIPTDDTLLHPTVDFRFVTKAPDCSGISVSFDTATQSGWSAEFRWHDQGSGISYEPVPVPTLSSYKPHETCK